MNLEKILAVALLTAATLQSIAVSWWVAVSWRDLRAAERQFKRDCKVRSESMR